MASIIVIGLVLLLDILAFVLAIGAERRRNTPFVVDTDSAPRPFCVYGTDASTWYGVGALALLLAGQAVAMAASRCFCCGRQPLLLLRPRALARPLALLLRPLLRPLLADVLDRGGVPAGGVGAERVPYQVREQLLRQRNAALRHAAQGRLRRRRRLRLPHHALRHAPLHLLLQGPRRAPAHHQRRRHRHDPHLS